MMNKTSRWAFAAGVLNPAWPAWAASSTPGIDPTLFVIGIAGAFAAGVAVGYAIGKSSGSPADDSKG